MDGYRPPGRDPRRGGRQQNRRDRSMGPPDRRDMEEERDFWAPRDRHDPRDMRDPRGMPEEYDDRGMGRGGPRGGMGGGRGGGMRGGMGGGMRGRRGGGMGDGRGGPPDFDALMAEQEALAAAIWQKGQDYGHRYYSGQLQPRDRFIREELEEMVEYLWEIRRELEGMMQQQRRY
ncbi:hypothetical protein LTR09_005006 [Extremus antarcticus]|uniref:Uncharacterized protein n=1 Tax=Extremus antarcticus TaxID=702011 RepID=A0AAJ0GDQ9_9PEZI|nr:hypothetical protein LTR09_005006 [Extremus antarcticus]